MDTEKKDTAKTDDIIVTLRIDPEQLAPTQAALGFLADVCWNYGVGGATNTRESRRYADALGYVTYIASEIANAVFEN